MEAIERSAWLKERRTGIGGTDAAAILGVSPWASPLSVWLEKRNEVIPKETTEPMRWGHALEELVAQRYAEETGRKVWNPESRIYRHAEHDFLLATPDRLIIGEERGLDIKTASGWGRDEWGAPGTDEIPEVYLVQMAHYMAVLDRPVWDVAVLFGGNDFAIYTVRRDEAVERMLLDRLVDFWNRCVVGGERPEVDGSAATSDAIGRRFRAEERGEIVKADDLAVYWLQQLYTARSAVEAAENRVETARNALKLAIGDAAGIEGGGFRVSWKATKAKKAVDWSGIARDLMAVLDAAGESKRVTEIVGRHSEERPGVRRFLFTDTTKRKEG